MDNFSKSHTGASERFQDLATSTRPFLIKRDIKSNVALHMYINGRSRQDTEPSNLRVTLENAIVDDNLLKSRCDSSRLKVVKTRIRNNAREVNELVPVEAS